MGSDSLVLKFPSIFLQVYVCVCILYVIYILIYTRDFVYVCILYTK